MTIGVEVVTAERWADLAELFERCGPKGGTPQTDGCWCQFWHVRGKAYWDGHGDGHRARLEAEVGQGDEPGLLAYMDRTAVGWCRLGARERFERLKHAPKLARVDNEPVWSVVCFYVHPTAKRKGVASALLDAALNHAAAHRAPILEAYPVREGHMNIDAYTGYLPMFLHAGFEQVHDAGRRVVVRKRLHAGGPYRDATRNASLSPHRGSPGRW